MKFESSLAFAAVTKRARRRITPRYDKNYEYHEERLAELDAQIAAGPTDVNDLLASRSKQERRFARQAIRRGLFLRETNRSAERDPLMARAVRNGRLDAFLRDIGRACFICGSEGLCRHRERPVIDAAIFREGERAEYLRDIKQSAAAGT